MVGSVASSGVVFVDGVSSYTPISTRLHEEQSAYLVGNVQE